MNKKPKICCCFGRKSGSVFINTALLNSDPLLTPNFRTSCPECSVKKLFLKILQNLQENTCVRVSFLVKFQTSAL